MSRFCALTHPAFAFRLLFLVALGFTLASCGVKGPPLPPLVPETLGEGRYRVKPEDANRANRRSPPQSPAPEDSTVREDSEGEAK